ncbi:MAG: hypothetical protein JWM32_2707 [Verrucomicrobia bacterium]|nr:hypothetical protein [Verrucomicrobiota bacterium]
MKTTISFKAWRGDRYLGLAEILIVIGCSILDLKWTLNLVEVAIGADAEALNSLNGRRGVGTLELLHLATPDVQIVDGTAEGYNPNNSLRIKVTAIDSSCWDVESEDAEIVGALRGRFKDLII